jgi:hypothetical protein
VRLSVGQELISNLTGSPENYEYFFAIRLDQTEHTAFKPEPVNISEEHVLAA